MQKKWNENSGLPKFAPLVARTSLGPKYLLGVNCLVGSYDHSENECRKSHVRNSSQNVQSVRSDWKAHYPESFTRINLPRHQKRQNFLKSGNLNSVTWCFHYFNLY